LGAIQIDIFIHSYSFIVARMGELSFCSHRAFKHAPLLRVPLYVSWAFLYCHAVRGQISDEIIKAICKRHVLALNVAC